jgi:hypothetical protein
MSSEISDTNPVAEQMLIALLRQARMARRIELAAMLISFVIEIAYRALRRGLLRGKRAGDRPAVRRVAVRPGTHRLRAALMPSAGDQDQ